MSTPRSPDWTDLLKIKRPLSQMQKKKKEHVTNDQREELLNFISENPEMVTHSSTEENEAALWEDVTKKLNAMKPEKSVLSWKIFWRRWRMSVETKNVASLTTVDYKLMKFIKNIEANFDNDTIITQHPKRTKQKESLTISDICSALEEVEKEKTELKLNTDRCDYIITIHKTQITELKKQVAQNKKRCAELSNKKAILNSKKKKLEEKENLN